MSQPQAQQISSQEKHQEQTNPQSPPIKIYMHLINRQNQSALETRIINAQQSLTLQECSTIIQQKIKLAMNNIQIKDKLDTNELDLTKSIKDLQIKNQTQLFVFYDGIKPLPKNQVQGQQQTAKQLHYQSITKYSFLDDKTHVKVYLQLPGIGDVPANKITSRFLDRSFQVKIEGYKNKNWIFAVPRSQCLIKVKDSKVIQKPNKLIISVGKVAGSDNWFSLYKTKMIGQKEDF